MVYISLLLSVAVFLGGALSYMANKALPGTFLYPYKVSVNEPLEEFLAHTDEAKAQLDLALLHQRLNEAEYLAVHSQLDAKAQTEVTDNITLHVQNLTATIERLKTKGQYKEAAALAARLHQAITDEVASVVDTSSQGSSSLQLSLAPVLVRLRTTLSTVALISTSAQAQAAGIKTKTVPSATIGSTVDSKL